jgi:glucose-6-phosphate isomerase
MPQLTRTSSWKELLKYAQVLKSRHLAEAFAADQDRFNKLHLSFGELTLDFSRQRLNAEALKQLCQLAEEQGLKSAIEKLFSGSKLNASEGREALHMALRAKAGANFVVEGRNVMGEVRAELKKALSLAEEVRAGRAKGVNGKTIRNIIHVGIGGSDLGPYLLAEALRDEKAPRIRFLRNVDAGPLQAAMRANPEETYVLVASKTFTTSETMLNARALKEWLGAGAAKQMFALTAAPEKAREFGIPEKNILKFWEWVGGRFSLWSVVSTAAMMAMGAPAFERLLQGGEEIDRHFLETPFDKNLPVVLALIDLWNINLLGARARAVVPYMEALAGWPAYLQQLEMESLGKSVDTDGHALDYATAPFLFGSTGTPAQHAFLQALHQGTETIPAEIILAARDRYGSPAALMALQANALAQADALAFGKQDADAAKACPGNRPSSVIVLKEMSPQAMGQLLALYEHKVFALGILWHLNPFDQWGVELGKQLAGMLEQQLAGKTEASPLIKLLRSSE